MWAWEEGQWGARGPPATDAPGAAWLVDTKILLFTEAESKVEVALPQGRRARVPITTDQTCAQLLEAVGEAAGLPHECLDLRIDGLRAGRIEHSGLDVLHAGVTPSTPLTAVQRELCGVCAAPKRSKHF
jgi:hypothetical protein